MHSITKQRGFSLAELLVAMAIMVILVGVAAPNLTPLITKNKVSVVSKRLIQSLHLARREALRRQGTVHVCKKLPQQSACSNDYARNRNFASGWIIFADSNQNNDFDADDTLIRQLNGETNINIVFNQSGRLRFFSNGSSRTAGFTVCNTQGQYYQHIYLFHSGKTRVSNQPSANQRNQCNSA